VTLNQLFKLARELQDKKQTVLAEELGKSSSAISKFEKGQSTLAEDTLQELAIMLNLNPAYITGASSNPFFSRELIKMHLPEEEFGIKIVFTPIMLIAEASQRMEVITLLPARKFRFMEKIEEGKLIEPPTYAIAVQDEDNNIFLFRRKSSSGYIMADRGLLAQLDELGAQTGKDIRLHTRKLTRTLFERIRDWEVTREDIEPYFSNRQPQDITEAEQLLIMTLRQKRIDPESIRQNLE